MEKNLSNHYEVIAESYDSLHTEIHQSVLPALIEALELKPDDSLVDLGSATGRLDVMLRNTAGLKYPVTCVEPCEAFLEHLHKRDGVVVVPKTAETFIDEMLKIKEETKKVPSFNKVYMTSSVHHFSDPKGCLGKLCDLIPKDGIVVIVERPKYGFTFPFLEEHFAKYNQSEYQTVSERVVPQLQTRPDIEVQVSNVLTPFKLKKERFFELIRGRFMSFFNDFTNDELEEYVKKLEKEKFSSVKEQDDVVINDQYVITKLIKT